MFFGVFLCFLGGVFVLFFFFRAIFFELIFFAMELRKMGDCRPVQKTQNSDAGCYSPPKPHLLESGLNQLGRAKSAAPPIKSSVETAVFRFLGCRT